MSNDNDVLGQSQHPQQKPSNSFKSLKPLVMLTTVILVAVATGISGYWLGQSSITTKVNDEQPATSISPLTEISPTIHKYTQRMPYRQTSYQNKQSKTFKTDMFSFNYPSSYMVIETSHNMFVIVNSPDKFSDEANIHIDATGSYYASYNDALEKVGKSLIDVQSENIHNGVKFTGKVPPGTGGGLLYTIAVFENKRGAVVVELRGDSSEEASAFNQIISSFQVTNSG
jgi:hypothetical protein